MVSLRTKLRCYGEQPRPDNCTFTFALLAASSPFSTLFKVASSNFHPLLYGLLHEGNEQGVRSVSFFAVVCVVAVIGDLNPCSLAASLVYAILYPEPDDRLKTSPPAQEQTISTLWFNLLSLVGWIS